MLESTMSLLSGRMQALDLKVSELPSRLERLEQRTDLLEKIFLFVDVEMLSNAISQTKAQRLGPAISPPACKVPSHSGVGESLMSELLRSVRGTASAASQAFRGSSRATSGSTEAGRAGTPDGGSGCNTPVRPRTSKSFVAPTVPSVVDEAPISPRHLTPSRDKQWGVAWPMHAPRPRSNSPVRAIGAEDAPLDIFAAIDAGRLDCLEELLRSRADPNVRRADSETALHRAAYLAQRDVMELLLSARADPSVRDKKGKTPMRKAYDNPDIVASLLKAGADANAVDEEGRTTLHRSAENGHVDVIEVLLEAGADPNIGNSEKETPAHEAANFGQTAALQALLRARADVNSQDENGALPLHFAACAGHADTVKLLIESKADAAGANKDGETPLQSAEYRDRAEVAEILRAVGG